MEYLKPQHQRKYKVEEADETILGNAEGKNNDESCGSPSKHVRNLYKPFERICKRHFR